MDSIVSKLLILTITLTHSCQTVTINNTACSTRNALRIQIYNCTINRANFRFFLISIFFFGIDYSIRVPSILNKMVIGDNLMQYQV